MIGASVAVRLGLTLPTLPAAAAPAPLAMASLLASLTLGAGLAPLGSGLRAGFRARWGALGLLAYVCLGVNTALESRIFTTFGGTAGMLVLFLPATAACAAAAAALFRPSGPSEPLSSSWRRFASQFPPSSWLGRMLLAVLAFPVVYFAFGMAVGPFVVDTYRSGSFGLRLPPIGEIVRTQLLRSTLFLAALVPALVLWRGSRLRLGAALGLAHYVYVGLFGMLQAYWLPATMRLLHGAEMLADSLAYTGVLAFILVRPGIVAASETSGSAPPAGTKAA